MPRIDADRLPLAVRRRGLVERRLSTVNLGKLRVLIGGGKPDLGTALQRPRGSGTCALSLIHIFLLCIINLIYAGRSTTVVAQERVKIFSAAGGQRVKVGIPALLFPVIILGGIYGGFMTPTEAAAISIIYAIPVGIYIYKEIGRAHV